MFLMNTWYVACTSADLGHKPLGRTICNQRMVFFRNAEQQAVAVEDFCPHRGSPLSLGRLQDGKLGCG